MDKYLRAGSAASSELLEMSGDDMIAELRRRARVARGDRPPEPPTQVPACPRIKLKQRTGFPGILWAGGAPLPVKYVEALEQNQMLASCCRHPENHDIEALFSSLDDADKGVPDIYIFHCPCGRMHRRFCVGGNKVNHQTEVVNGRRVTKIVVVEEDVRPFWTVR